MGINKHQGIMGRQRELWGDRGNYEETNNSAGTLYNQCFRLKCCIAEAVIFVFNVSNYFTIGGGWMRGNIEFFLNDLKKNLTFFFSCF